MKDYNELSDTNGESLVKTARAVVSEYLKNNNRVKLDKNFQSNYSFNSGVFVTLNNPTGLRGCIGFPLPDKKLFNALKDASIAAATEDPRFSPVRIEELDEITFEVTVLTPPEEITVKDPLEYPSQIFGVSECDFLPNRSFYNFYMSKSLLYFPIHLLEFFLKLNSFLFFVILHYTRNI